MVEARDMGALSNINLEKFRLFLTANGLSCIRTAGGHEVWYKKGMTRPVVFQTHLNPIPEFILKNSLRDLGITRKEFEEYLKKK